ncbi:MAG: 3-isopropylmalate dehydratase large subunit [Nitrososphaeria archaeon]
MCFEVIVTAGKTLADKIWDAHVIVRGDDERDLLYVDRHIVHEVTSPVAFDELRSRGIGVRRPDLTFAIVDHDIPTVGREASKDHVLAAEQIASLYRNAKEFGILLFDCFSPYQGIAHVTYPELGLTLPGATIACGDSHTSTHGALGALALGIGTSELAHVLATQTLWLKKPKNMRVTFRGHLPYGVTSKDAILFAIKVMGVGGGFGHIIEFGGGAVDAMSVEERMTICNMSVEAGARTSIVPPDGKTLEYVKDKPFSPKGQLWDEFRRFSEALNTDSSARFEREVAIDVSRLEPQVTWGTNPAMTSGITERVPSPEDIVGESERKAVERALKYMNLEPGTKISDIEVEGVFIGSCTNGRLSDLISVAKVVKGKKVNEHVKAIIVPGSQLVKRNAERLGLHNVFTAAGFEFRNSGCSFCLGMNEDRFENGARVASTSNRNFENRQGLGVKTHLVSPIMAAAAAVEGHFVDVRELDLEVDLGEV